MSADGEHIDPPFLGVDLRFAKTLHCVHMEQRRRILGIDALRDLPDRLHRADLVVRVHDGYQDRVVPNGLLHEIGGDNSVLINRKIGHLESLGFQIAHRFQDGRMLDRGCDQMAASAGVCQSPADNRDIVGLRAAGSEEEIFLIHARVTSSPP